MSLDVSIAMCTYNGARFVLAQLNSLAAQTHAPYEVIVCDDRSDDETIDIVREFAAVAPFPVRVIVNDDRVGYRLNFMKAISLCNGEIIAFCDQDDIWRADKLSLLAAEFRDPDVLMVHHNARLVQVDGVPFGQINPPGAFPPSAPALSQNPWHYSLGFTQAFRRELAAVCHLRATVMGERENEWTAHDQWISFLASSLGKTIYIDLNLADYRQHDKNTYGLAKNIRNNSVIDVIIEKICDFRDYNNISHILSRRIVVLQNIEADPGNKINLREAAADARRWYINIYELYQKRAAAYSRNTILGRFSAWRELIRAGGYSSRSAAYFTKKSGLRDVLQGVFLAKLKGSTAPTADFSLKISTGRYV